MIKANGPLYRAMCEYARQIPEATLMLFGKRPTFTRPPTNPITRTPEYKAVIIATPVVSALLAGGMFFSAVKAKPEENQSAPKQANSRSSPGANWH